LNIAVYKKHLQELREHVEAAEDILKHIDNNELCKVFDAVKDFISGEEAKLSLEQKNELLPVKRTIKKYKISLVDRFVCRPFLCG